VAKPAARLPVVIALLVPLLVAIAWGSRQARWHSAPSVDSRTYIEMIRGISDNGLPYLANGPASRFPELRARWNAPRGDRLWATYPPVFPYAAVPFFRAGGLAAVTSFDVSLLLLLAVGTFLLGARYAGDPLAGAASSYLVVLSTAVSAVALDIGPYALVVTLIVWSSYLGLLAIDTTGRASRAAAFGCGVTGGLAVGTHLLTFPMLVVLIFALAAFAVAGSSVPASLGRLAPRLRRWLPPRAALARGGLALLGALAALAPVAVLNQARFGTWNPVTYGPCVWRACFESGLANQSVGAMLAYALPVAVWVAATAAAAWLVRRSRLGLVGVAAAALLVLAAWEVMRQHAVNIFAVAWSCAVDSSPFDVSPMVHPPDGLGTFFGPFVIKSTLQAVPFVVLACFAPVATAAQRQRTLLLALPCGALFAALALRANLPLVHAIGFPFLHLRYMLPMLPLLVVLAIGAVRDLPWRVPHLLLVIAGAVALGIWLWLGDDDGAYLRRFVLLRASLALAIAAAAALLLARRRGSAWTRQAAVILIALTAAFGIGVNLAVDVKQIVRAKQWQDALVDAIGARTPERFALVGWAPEIDTPLSLRATRDIEYADLYESTDWTNFRALLDYWAETNRPVYTLFPVHRIVRSPWPDIAFEPVDPVRGLWIVHRR
jgi:hypothetical protein